MRNSRLTRLDEKRTKKRLILVIAGIIGLIALLFTVGIPIIVGASVLLGNLKSKTVSTDNQDKTPPFPPVINPLPEATNSAKLVINGYGEPESTLKIFLNGTEVKNSLLGAEGGFEYNDIRLKEGENILYAQVTDSAGNTSNPSEDLKISFKKEGPTLEISEPVEGQSFGRGQENINIKGKTDQGSSIRINSRFVSVKDDGSFEFPLKLNSGENTIQIIARDAASNQTTKDIKVTYNPD